MANKTYNDHPTDNTPAADDLIPYWDVAAGAAKKAARTAVIGATITGAGTIATGGNTLTVPASGTAALLEAANTFTGAQSISGLATLAGGLRSGSISNISVNSAVGIAGTSGALLLYPNISGGTPFGLIVARPDGATIIMATTADTLATANNTVLTGTTGASSKVTVSWTGSVWYIENRLTYAINYKYLLLS